MALNFTGENFEDEVIKSDVPVLVDFYADWCGPCKMMSPVIDKIAAAYEGKVKVGKINTEADPELAARFGVQGIPFFAFFKDGKLVDSVVGGVPQPQLENKLNALL